MSPTNRDLSLRERLLIEIGRRPWRSAYQLSIVLDADSSSVSSILVKLCASGDVRRQAGRGPRGGHGYALPAASRAKRARASA